jgi:hypothetical protein
MGACFVNKWSLVKSVFHFWRPFYGTGPVMPPVV